MRADDVQCGVRAGQGGLHARWWLPQAHDRICDGPCYDSSTRIPRYRLAHHRHPLCPGAETSVCLAHSAGLLYSSARRVALRDGRAAGALSNLTPAESTWRLVAPAIGPNHRGCVQGRLPKRGRLRGDGLPGCVFDGRLSLVFHRGREPVDGGPRATSPASPTLVLRVDVRSSLHEPIQCTPASATCIFRRPIRGASAHSCQARKE